MEASVFMRVNDVSCFSSGMHSSGGGGWVTIRTSRGDINIHGSVDQLERIACGIFNACQDMRLARQSAVIDMATGLPVVEEEKGRFNNAR